MPSTELKKRERCIYYYDNMHVTQEDGKCVVFTKAEHLKASVRLDVIEGQCDIWLGEGEYILTRKPAVPITKGEDDGL